GRTEACLARSRQIGNPEIVPAVTVARETTRGNADRNVKSATPGSALAGLRTAHPATRLKAPGGVGELRRFMFATTGLAMMNTADASRPQLKMRRTNLDTGRENVVVISRRSTALRPEVFRGFSRVELRRDSKVLLATLLITDDDGLVGPDELGIAEPAFRRFSEPVGSLVTVT